MSIPSCTRAQIPIFNQGRPTDKNFKPLAVIAILYAFHQRRMTAAFSL